MSFMEIVIMFSETIMLLKEIVILFMETIVLSKVMITG